MTEERWLRIEMKVDKLVEAMTDLIRFEEKIAQQELHNERHVDRLDNLEERVEEIEKKIPVIDWVVSGVGKIVISVATVVILGMVGTYFINQ